MLSVKRMEEIMSYVLSIGTLFSALLVLIGGFSYLQQHAHTLVQPELFQHTSHVIQLKKMLHFQLSPFYLIELGLLMLIATQIFRVGLLMVFYIITRDYWFTLISFFILLTLLYSFAFR